MEDKVQIEFTEEELSPDYVPGNDEGAGDGKETQIQNGSEDGADTEGKDNGRADDEGAAVSDPAASEDAAAKEIAQNQTDAELAAIYGMSEADIKYAKNMGWSTKDKFKGDPNDWKDPKKFIDIAEQSAPVLRDRMREMSKKITAMQEAFPTILEMQKRELQTRVDSLTEKNEKLQEELQEAHMMADSKKAQELTEKIMENKLKIALTEEEQKRVGQKDGSAKTANGVITPDYIDVEKERAWRDSIYPKLTLEQREIYNDAVKFIMNPINADQTTDQRIAYIESKIFGRRATPAAAPVARPSAIDVSGSSSSKNNEYQGWDAMSQEDKDVAVSIIKETDWYKNRETDPKAKAKWNDFKKQFK